MLHTVDHSAGNVSCSCQLRVVRHIAFLMLIVGAATLVRADEPPPALAPPTPTEVAIPVVQIAERAAFTDSQVRAIRARLGTDDATARITQNLPGMAAQIDQLEHDSVAQLAAGLTPQALDDLRRQWLLIKDQLTSWTQAIGTRTDAVEQDSARLSELDQAWATTAAGARENEFPAALREPIRIAQASIRDTLTALRAQRDTLLALLGRISGLQTQVSEALSQLGFSEEQMRRGLLSADAPPLWMMQPERARIEPIGTFVRTGLNRNRSLAQAFLQQQSRVLVLHGIVLVLLLLTTIPLSRRVRDSEPADDMSPAVRAVLTRPLSAAFLLALMVGAGLHPYAPIFVANLLGVALIIPLTRLVRGPTAAQMRLALLLLAVMLLASTLRRLLPPFVPAARYVLIAETIGSMVSIVFVLHPARLAKLDLTHAWRRALGVAMWSMLTLLTLSTIGNLTGTVALAILLTDGVLGAATAAVAFLVANRVVEALLVQAIRSDWAQRLRSIASHSRPLRRRAVRIVRALMALLWLSVTLNLFGLFTSFRESVSDALAARLTIGTLSLSLADVLTVLVTLWVSLLIARVVRVVLEEDALPHLSLPRGVPAAISVGVNYTILLIGLVLALSAAGVDPGRITLVAGALGVGIGFGLQTVVNNFVSGIILLFERPIQIGDIITLGDVNGQVRRIGFRSSTIATYDGAEVVIPNGFLVSERVVNWTLSNYQRRIEVKVGVAYGNDPTAVIAVLEGSVKSVAELLEYPAPLAVFTGFGEKSLDFTLWVWTDHQDTFATERSHVAIAVYEALRSAGIEIPFPQREPQVTSDAPVARKSAGSDEGGH